MVTKVYRCPHCEQSENVVRHGFTRWGSQRLRCKVCRRAWTPEGKSRTLSAEKEALMTSALEERLSQRAIARTLGSRTLGCGRDTVQRVLKKSLSKAA